MYGHTTQITGSQYSGRERICTTFRFFASCCTPNLTLSHSRFIQKKAYKKEEKAQANRFEMHDHYNSEGQHRNYNRNLKSIRPSAASGSDALEVSDPLWNNNNPVNKAHEREGARNIASEMKRRIEKQAKKKRERVDFEETDVSYINNRNKKFNQKISRNFDKHTAEIRQNLERGTAL
jgi:hypothetical protein